VQKISNCIDPLPEPPLLDTELRPFPLQINNKYSRNILFRLLNFFKFGGVWTYSQPPYLIMWGFAIPLTSAGVRPLRQVANVWRYVWKSLHSMPMANYIFLTFLYFAFLSISLHLFLSFYSSLIKVTNKPFPGASKPRGEWRILRHRKCWWGSWKMLPRGALSILRPVDASKCVCRLGSAQDPAVGAYRSGSPDPGLENGFEKT